MGLALVVGFLADMLENDEEGAEWFQEEMERTNGFLESEGLEPHTEPETCEIFSCDMYGYSGLHYLRRIAAHLDLRSALPPPGKSESDSDGEEPSEDPVLAEYIGLAVDDPSSNLRGFDHLILHSDAEGYYLPQDFDGVLFPPETVPIAGGMIGSSTRLMEECERLASELELPLDLDPGADSVWQAVETQGEGATKWQRYGIESYVCLRLHHAAQHSIKTGAAIVFC